jgi:hypothetical protein
MSADGSAVAGGSNDGNVYYFKVPRASGPLANVVQRQCGVSVSGAEAL